MTISVLVPAYNEAAGLAASLASIRAAMQAFAARGWTSELIVCDNNSTDATAAIAHAAGAAVVFEPVNQISRARNAAAARASGDWLVFVDADSHPPVALFADAADAIASGQVVAGGSVVAMESSSRFGDALVAAWNLVSRLTGWAAGAFIFVDATAFRAVGGFSQQLYAAEEIDLFRRLKHLARRQGRRVVILRAHPLLTSGRKLRLHSPGRILSLILRTVVSGGRTLRRPQDLPLWYDGRR
ncbi:MAG: glycosyltransferase [Vicinamibacterales bacterium]